MRDTGMRNERELFRMRAHRSCALPIGCPKAHETLNGIDKQNPVPVLRSYKRVTCFMTCGVCIDFSFIGFTILCSSALQMWQLRPAIDVLRIWVKILLDSVVHETAHADIISTRQLS